MTRELLTQKTTIAPYSVRLEEANVVEIEKVKVEETESKIIINVNRFKRYKRSLQKRARNIL
jgi:hypothetical protein